MSLLPRHVAENRRHWDATADRWVAAGERAWAQMEPTWGIWGVPNSELPLLPESLREQRAIELGCGTGYVSAWMQRRGAEVYAIDNSSEQLSTAERLAGIYDVERIKWVHGDAEAVAQPDESFDFAISEYGAAIWCEPRRWLTEAHRILRPGGQLVFLGHHPLAMVCAPQAGDDNIGVTLERSYFELGELDWTDAVKDPGGIEFNLPISEWMALFREIGFEIDNYVEVKAPDSAEGTQFWMPADWSKNYPSEQVWWLRRSQRLQLRSSGTGAA
jgi:SAM-dependent methyltransferase